MQLSSDLQQQITDVLGHFADPEEISLPYAQGVFFGLAITPDVVNPQEWIPLLLDVNRFEQFSQEQLQEALDPLLHGLNQHIEAFNQQQLDFPFDLDNPGDETYQQMLDWGSGLDQVLRLREETWQLENHEQVQDKDLQNLHCCRRLLSAFNAVEELEPAIEQLRKMEPQLPCWELLDEATDEAEEEMEGRRVAVLLMMMPLAVDVLQAFGHLMEEERQQQVAQEGQQPQQ